MPAEGKASMGGFGRQDGCGTGWGTGGGKEAPWAGWPGEGEEVRWPVPNSQILIPVEGLLGLAPTI